MPRRRPAAVLAAGAATAAAALIVSLTGCTTTVSEAPAGIRVVASTDVYGDLAKTIGGSYATVTSIIDNPSKDPHEYQADARTQLAVSKAQIIIENGGGYDDFVDTMLSASGNTKASVINAVKLSGYDAKAAGFNEHVFYDYPTVGKVIDAMVAEFGKADPSHSATFADRGAQLRIAVDTLENDAKNLSATTQGVGVAITEPVPDYVLKALGMKIVTPTAFSAAIEQGTDAPAAVLEQTLGTLSNREAKVLVYNVQTSGAQTDAVLAAAKKAKVPAVPVSETLPAGLTYIEWQKGVLATIAQALAP
ncbi:MAG: zinc ABC transporter substrate-binding protein [Actinomycetota bacterium]|nr:zinc ABC transporter substrate-binding protein [Actinomycetota bacterium]